MKIIWQVDSQDIAYVRSFFANHQHDPMVQERRRRNLADDKPPLAKGFVWTVMVSCLLTTQQRSGPQSAITRFISTTPFPLDYDLCLRQDDLLTFVQRVLTGFGGIRRTNIIASEVNTNLPQLEQGLWTETLAMLDRLRHSPDPAQERQAAEFIRRHFKGFGPKQSRNFLQGLGLTRYEVPIDSRICKWLNNLGFPIRLSTWSLSDPDYYNLISDGFQHLCAQSDLYPCLLDAAIFTSFDRGGWTEENVVW